jgi:hypothetical protein
MEIKLMPAQLNRIIEILEKSQGKTRSDTYLINYLKQHQKPTYAQMVSLDEIPF